MLQTGVRFVVYAVGIGSFFVVYRMAWERYSGVVDASYELVVDAR